MDHQLFSLEIVLDAKLAEQAGSELGLLGFVHLGANDATTPNVEKEVKVEESAPHGRAAQVRDIPAQHAQRFTGNVLPWLVVAWGWLAALPIAVELALRQDTTQ